MMKENLREESTISTSLSSTLRRLLSKHEADIHLLAHSRPKAAALIDELKGEEYPDDPSIKCAKERLYIWDKEISWFYTLTALADAIDSNPYPGEKVRLLALAKRLFPGTSLRQWVEMFRWVGIEHTMRLCFPVAHETINIADLEKQLLDIIAHEGVILASQLEVIVRSPVRSKRYRDAKEQLQSSGWRWAHQRRGNSTVRVINPPSTFAPTIHYNNTNLCAFNNIFT